MTKQEIFDRVAAHLLLQGQRAMSSAATGGTRCSYRANGMSCAIGCLISDEAYAETLEGAGVNSRKVQAALVASGVSPAGELPNSLLRSLQRVHDDAEDGDYYLTNIREALRAVADIHGLKM